MQTDSPEFPLSVAHPHVNRCNGMGNLCFATYFVISSRGFSHTWERFVWERLTSNQKNKSSWLTKYWIVFCFSFEKLFFPAYRTSFDCCQSCFKCISIWNSTQRKDLCLNQKLCRRRHRGSQMTQKQTCVRVRACIPVHAKRCGSFSKSYFLLLYILLFIQKEELWINYYS